MKLRTGNPEEVGMSSEKLNQIKELAEGWSIEGHHPALEILVARKGVIVLHEAYGRLTPLQDSPPLQLDTIFPLASLTKPITATAVMILVEDGLLGLNRPVSAYLHEFVGGGKEMVMVHQLLTHTSGISDDGSKAYIDKVRGSIEIPPPDDNQNPEIHEMLNLSYGAPLSEAPGSVMMYADLNYDYLGEIIRRTSGKSLPEFITERILSPLGMESTFYGTSPKLENRIVQRGDAAPFVDLENVWKWGSGSGGGFSTVNDYAIFGQMFLNGGSYGGARILSPPTVAAMTSNQIPGTEARFGDIVLPEAGWGLGWCIKENKILPAYGEYLQSPKTFEQGGAGGVFLWIDPEYEVIGAYFSVLHSIVNEFIYLWDADLYVNAVMASIVD